MSPKSAELFKQALELSIEERADLAAQILDSLDSSADLEVQAAWQAEIERRMAQLHSGEVQGLSIEEAKRQVRSTLE
ncbi:MAG: addiction module protein [Acidobacteria bacterium]|nr:addiction module protein [Acidobacteriota bacterium]MBS1865442.1 addiction module protein [Acidobacteriota bacterium]